MVKLTLFKNLLANLKQVPTPMLLASIAVHALLLTIPISYSLTHKSSQPQKETTKTETVQVASIPNPSISTPSPSNSLFDPKKAMVPEKKAPEKLEKLTLSVANPITVPQLPPPPPLGKAIPISSPSSSPVGGSVGKLPPPPVTGAQSTAQTLPSTGSIQLPSPPLPANLASQTKPITISQKPPKLPNIKEISQKPPIIPNIKNIPQKPPKLPNIKEIPQKPPKLPNIKEIPQKPPIIISNKVPKASVSSKVTEKKTPSVIKNKKPSIPPVIPDIKPGVTGQPLSKPTISPPNTTTPIPKVEPFSNFPKYTDASSGSNGLFTSDLDKNSLKTTDKLEKVIAFFEKELSNEYQLEKIADAKDSRVYKVSQNNTVRYLHLLEDNSQGTVIILNKDLVNLQDLTSPEKQYFEEFITKFEGLTKPNKETTFAQPEKFDASVSGIEKIVGAIADKTPEEFVSLLKGKLEAEDFTVTPIGEYGGGALLQVKKRAFTQYISIVPSGKSKEVVVVTWKQLPPGIKG